MTSVVAFATLFLGLVVGPQQVTLLVADTVARVEVRVDDRVCLRLERSPWQGACDLGATLAPRVLDAVAYDRAGAELGRARQWLNLPRPPAEAKLVLRPAPSGRGAAAQLSWRSVGLGVPTVRVLLDGEPLAVADPGAIILPDYDPQRLHLLRAELEFDQEVSAVAEATFGGFFADEVSTELTAFALDVAGREPSLEQLTAWATIAGRPARAVALERGSAEVVVVRDASAREPLLVLLRDLFDRATTRRSGLRSVGTPPPQEVARQAVPLGNQTTLRFVWPRAEERMTEDLPMRLFPRTADFRGHSGGWLWLLATTPAPAPPPAAPGSGAQLLADAVAVAGMNVTAMNRRRAVVLVLGPAPEDQSSLRLDDVRRYLGLLGVPLAVWSIAPRPPGGLDDDVRAVTSHYELAGAVRDLEAQLKRQRLLWVDGRHLPQWLRLDAPEGSVRSLHREP